MTGARAAANRSNNGDVINVVTIAIIIKAENNPGVMRPRSSPISMTISSIGTGANSRGIGGGVGGGDAGGGGVAAGGAGGGGGCAAAEGASRAGTCIVP